MQLVINSFGSYLRKQGEGFVVKNDEKVFEVSARKVESILITTSAYLSTDAIKLASDHNIDVVFLDEFGNPYGRVWHSKLGSTVLIRRRQLEIANQEEGLTLAKEWVSEKLTNQIELLKRLANSRPEKEEQLKVHFQRLEENKAKLDDLSGTIDEKRGTMMGLEGSAGRTYFESLSFIMPDRYKFDGRSRQPAKDEFNCLLNYGYGVLYSMVEKGCIIAGLDPYVGFIHTDNYNKKSLVFDLIEMFRILADQTVVYLFSGRKVKQEHFDEVKGGLTLNKEGRAALLEALNETFEKTVRYNGRNIKNKDIIQFECHRIANSLIKGEEDAGLGNL
ncbi:MAG: CRISPR-associated endonuclease Cas1 [Nitrospirae bacterium]|nr:CRISPR-associated endonuclease Cas1 [Nitrospirota bacterium]